MCAAVERNAVAVDKRMVIRGGTQVVSELDVVGDRGAVEVLRWMDPLGVVGKVDPVRALPSGGEVVVVNIRMGGLGG